MRFTAFDPAPGFAGCGVLTARGEGLDVLLDEEAERTPVPDAMRIDLAALSAVPALQFRRLDAYGALGVAMARQALRAAGVPGAMAAEPGWGVMIGSSTGCGASNARHHRALRDRPTAEPNASGFVRTVANAVNGDISIALRCTGAAQTFVSGSTAGAEALIAAGAELSAGRARFVLAGGIESTVARRLLHTSQNPIPHQPLRPSQGAQSPFVAQMGVGPLGDPAGPATISAPPWAGCGAILLLGSDGRATEPGALRLAAFWRGHDPGGRWSPAGALDALHPRRFARILIANTIPADRLAVWREEAREMELLDLPRRTGEPGAAGAVIAAAMASRLDGSSLVIAHDPAGGIAVLALVRGAVT